MTSGGSGCCVSVDSGAVSPGADMERGRSAGAAVAGAGVAAEAQPEAVHAAGGGPGPAAHGGEDNDGRSPDQDVDRSALPADLHDSGRAEASGAQRLVVPGAGRRAMERDDDAVAGWGKEVWSCAEDSRRRVKPGSSSRTKPDSPRRRRRRRPGRSAAGPLWLVSAAVPADAPRSRR
jgi:hypothetical protein